MTTTGSNPNLYKFLESHGDRSRRERVRRLVETGKASRTPAGAHAVSRVAGSVLKYLKEYINDDKRTGPAGRTSRRAASEIIKEFGVEKAVTLTTHEALQAAMGDSDRRTLVQVRASIADSWMLEQDYRVFHEDSGASTNWDAFKKRRRGVKYLVARARNMKSRGISLGCTWDRKDVLNAVSVVLELILQHSGIFTKEQKIQDEPGLGRSRRKLQYFIGVTQHFRDWFEQCEEMITELMPLRGPTDHCPLDWNEDGIGGFREGALAQIHLFGRRHARSEVDFDGRECPEVLRGINTIQRTPWQVNNRVREVFDIAYRQEWSDTGFQYYIHPKPEYVDAPAESEAAAQYRRDARRHYVSEEAYNRSKLRAGRIRYMAQVYSELDRFYYVHMLDFRGRVYPLSSFWHYQGCDAERGILQFADAKRISTFEGLRWFLIHGANRFGFDKVPFDARVEWCNENHDKIMQSAENPIDNRWWLDADCPWQFLAWAFEYADMRKMPDPLDYESRIPVAMDGSNNGLQMYSLMFRDEVGGYATNCMPCDEPQDAYRAVADKVTEILRDHIENPTDAKLERWSKEIFALMERMGTDRVPREAVKRPVMTQPYGCTKFTCQRYVIDWYFEWVRDLDLTQEQKVFRHKDTYKIFRWLGDLVWDAIAQTVVKAREAMEWIQEVSDIYTEHGKHLEWHTPHGFKVFQRYRKSELKRVGLWVGGDIKIFVSHINSTPEIDSTRSRNGACPNFVHSFDAAVMWETVNKAAEAGVTHFQMIHDSFGTHACDAPRLAEALRDACIDIFTQPVVDRAYREWQDGLPGVALPEPPKQGNLTIQDLKKAEYFFA